MLWQGIQALIELLKESKTKRTALTTVQGATFASASAATTTVVTGAANVNGIIVRTAGVAATGAGNASVQAGAGNHIAFIAANAGNAVALVVKDIFIPPGVALVLSSSAVATLAYCFYEVL